MNELVVVLILVVAVLQVILFFKIWGMTNDVRELRKKFVVPGVSLSNFNFKVRKLILSGKREKAVDMLLDDFFEKIESLGSNGFLGDTETVIYEIQKHKVRLDLSLRKLGVELPEGIKNLKSGKDFNDLL